MNTLLVLGSKGKCPHCLFELSKQECLDDSTHQMRRIARKSVCGPRYLGKLDERTEVDGPHTES